MVKVNKSISFNVSTIIKIEKYRESNGITDFSKANEELVLKGLNKSKNNDNKGGKKK